MRLPKTEVLEKIYGESRESRERFESLAKNFKENFQKEEMEFFTAPGRTEIVGNHTDHNGGKILAASIDMDTIGAAYPNGTDTVRIISEGYGRAVEVRVADAEKTDKMKGTLSLTAGMIDGALKRGFHVQGFDLYVSTKVISSAGVSSSASFEMLVCSVINYFFNDSKMDCADYARIGQYAENHFWNKSSGLMDQMACAAGGAILLDFSDGVKYQTADFSFDKMGCDLVIVNTGKGHADLSDEYSEIPQEMKEIARELGVSTLCESTEEKLVEKILAGEIHVENDRAILRALHFYEENRRVEKAAEAVKENDKETLLAVIKESGESSWKWLQNCVSRSDYNDQRVALTLAMTELFLKKKNRGCCRVHGGGFAGVIMCVTEKEDTQEYISYISRLAGKENVYPMRIRSTGASHIEKE